ncbi:MAG: hypothetical protein CSA66_04490 [Proteobacteria bacterium]|nr:MAG: hypothetical protein CSA66_04490 [Pseudomonadota bacterium]
MNRAQTSLLAVASLSSLLAACRGPEPAARPAAAEVTGPATPGRVERDGAVARVRELIAAIAAKDEAAASAVVHPRVRGRLGAGLATHRPECGAASSLGAEALGPRTYLADAANYKLARVPSKTRLEGSGWGPEDGVEELATVTLEIQRPGDLRAFAWELTLGRGADDAWSVLGYRGGEVQRGPADRLDPWLRRCCDRGLSAMCLDAARYLAGPGGDPAQAQGFVDKACAADPARDCAALKASVLGKATEPAPTTPTDTAPPTKRLAKPTGAALAQVKAQGRRFMELLSAGRRLIKAKRYADGIALYEQALVIDPSHAPLLGELGWAAYLSGDLARARALTERALTLAKAPKRRAMLLYNLGRVAQDDGREGDAVSAYARSLSLRENATVRSRYEALLAAGSTIARYPGVAALCEELLDEWGCATEEGDDEEPCECEATASVPDDRGPPPFIEVITIAVTGLSMGMVDAEYIAIKGPKGLSLVGMVANSWTPGVAGISNQGEIKEINLLAPDVVFIVATNDHTDIDMGYNAITYSGTEDLWVCKGARCVHLIVAHDEGLDAIDEAAAPPPEDEYGPLGETRWALDWQVAPDGAVTLSEKAGEIPEQLRALLGTHSVEELGQMKGAFDVVEL